MRVHRTHLRCEGSEGSKGSACLWQAGSEGKVLKMDGPSAQGFLSLTGPLAPRVAVLPLCGNAYKVSVAGFTFSIIWYEKQFCGLAHCVRFPLSGFAGLLHGKACHTILRSLRFLTNRVPLPPLFRGRIKHLEASLRKRLYSKHGLLSPVEVLHRTSKWGEVRRLACPLRRFPFAAPPNCGGGKGTGFIGKPRDPRIQ